MREGLLLWNQAWGHGRAVCRADMRAIIQVELIKVGDWILEELWVILRAQVGRWLVLLEAILGEEKRGGMC